MTMRSECQFCGQWLDIMQITPHACQKPESLVERLRKRAEIRRQIPGRKSVQNGEPDKIADLLEEAAAKIEIQERDYNFMKDLAIGAEDALKRAKAKIETLEDLLLERNG